MKSLIVIFSDGSEYEPWDDSEIPEFFRAMQQGTSVADEGSDDVFVIGFRVCNEHSDH